MQSIINTIIFVAIAYVAYRLLMRVNFDRDVDDFRQLAKNNGWRVRVRVPSRYFPPVVSSDMTNSRSTFQLIGRHRKLRFHIFPFMTDLGGDYDFITSMQWITYINLNKSLPYFIVNSKINKVKIPERFTNYSKLQLEGGFSEHFEVFAPLSEHINVMSVLAPDVMHVCQHNPQIDIIVAGRKVWLITAASPRKDEESIDNLARAIETIIPELQHRSKTYKH